MMSNMRRTLVVLAALTLAGCGASSTASGGATTTSPTSANSAPTAAPKPTKQMTKGQEQALGSARDYLKLSAFSYKGLIEQLIQGDGYSRKDATFAADNVHANWAAEAAKAAKAYLEVSHFSHSGLVDQLVQGDHYTKAQAEYGVKKAGL